MPKAAAVLARKFMQSKLQVKSPAKLNLSLEILSKRPDGYHNLRTIFHQLKLADQLIIEKTSSGIEIQCEAEELPLAKDNLCYKAASLFLERFSPGAGVRIELVKHIPIAGGLGGGSSNAGVTLQAMARLFGVQEERETLLELAAKIGADVPFFLYEASAALGEGIGEKLQTLPGLSEQAVLLLKPRFSYFPGCKKSPHLYKLYDQALAAQNTAQLQHASRDRLQEILVAKDFLAMRNEFHNCFEPLAFAAYPELMLLKERMYQQGALFAAMSGAGPTIFGIFANTRKRAAAAQAVGALADCLETELAAVVTEEQDKRR